MENLSHFGAVGYRLVGSGSLKTTLYSLDDTYSSSLANITMSATTNRQPVILANFIQQRAALRFEVNSIDESFLISRLEIFVKPIAAEFPR